MPIQVCFALSKLTTFNDVPVLSLSNSEGIFYNLNKIQMSFILSALMAIVGIMLIVSFAIVIKVIFLIFKNK